MKSPTPLSRRAFVSKGSLYLFAAGASSTFAHHAMAAADDENKTRRLLRAGLITDLHHADKDPRGTRYYRESLGKLAEAGTHFEKDPPDFVVELGDLIDAADSVETELGYLKSVYKEFAALPGEKHCVLGNHCVDTLTKEEFLGEVGQEKSFYSFDRAGVHFVILDSCFLKDGTPYQRKNFQWTDANIPGEELEWLQADLGATEAEQVIVFAHQRLDRDDADKHTVNNASAVRGIFEDSGKVNAVFQGHSHSNDHHEIEGIHYITMVAMVEGSGAENSGYSTLDVLKDGTLRMDGHRKQADYEWQ
jgi:alkaline phosphatase